MALVLKPDSFGRVNDQQWALSGSSIAHNVYSYDRDSNLISDENLSYYTTTGTVKLRAIFDNDQLVLFPNQFVNVKLLVNTLHDADIVPNSAIQRGAPGTFVYVVKPENTVAVQKVKLGPSDGQRIPILSGLEPGQSVVTDGADRLRDGAKVTIASPQPAASTTEAPPQPQDQQQRQGSGRRRSTP